MKMKNTGHICFSPEGIRRTGYSRLSRKELDGRETLSRHIEQLRESGATEVYWDIISRSSHNRVGLNAVMSLIKERQTTEIILIRLDRLTDSHVLMEDFIETVISSNIPCRGLHDSIDLTTVGGRTHARLLVTFSRNEMERISERYKDGWEGVRRRQRGVHAPFGYVIKNGRHELDRSPFLCLIEDKSELSRADVAKDVISTFFKVKSLRGCIKQTNIKYGLWHSNHVNSQAGMNVGGVFHLSASGTKNWLTSPVLRGHIVYFRNKPNEIMIYDAHPEQALISYDQFEEIKLIVQTNKTIRGFGLARARYPLTGLVFCEECGGSCWSTQGKNKGCPTVNDYFKCKNSTLRSCTIKCGIRMDVAEEAVIKKLVEAYNSVERKIANESEPVSEELVAVEQELERLISLPNYPEIEALRQRLRSRITMLKHSKSGKSQHNDSMQTILTEAIRDVDFFRSREDSYRREIYQHLVERVIVTQESYEGISRKRQKVTLYRGVVKEVILKI